MAVFDKLDWANIDVMAIVARYGLLTVDDKRVASHRTWLSEAGYKIVELDCGLGFAHVLDEVNRLFRWDENFGYELSVDRCSLDAVNDGFEFDFGGTSGIVLQLNEPDVLWETEPKWILGLLSIVNVYSHTQLALGNRFFTLLVMPDSSPLIGQIIDSISVPSRQNARLG